MTGEEVKLSEFESNGVDVGIAEWQIGLPTLDHLPPLSHSLLPPELASAFCISPLTDLNFESHNTLSSGGGVAREPKAPASSSGKASNNEEEAGEPMAVDPEAEVETEVDVEEINIDRDGSSSEPRKLRRIDSEEADSVLRLENSDEDPSARLKRQRLVWSPQLHRRFVEVVVYLGIKDAVPKTIMQLMNVEGLTRENVASHLQKYRLYLKRKQGLSKDGSSPSDQLFASSPVPQSLRGSGSGAAAGGGSAASYGNGSGNGHVPVPINPVPYHPMPMYGHMGMQVYHNHPFNVVLEQRDWSGNYHGPVMPYPPHLRHVVPPNDNM